MAEALVSPLVSRILEQLASITNIEEMKLIVGDAEVDKLNNNLSSIQAVLEDAESKQMKDTVRCWLNMLQHTSYDIDDVLDEWNTITAQKLRTKEVEKSRNLLKKVCYKVSSHISCSIPVVLHQTIALRIKEINKTLDAIVQEKGNFNFSLNKSTRVEQQMTSSVIHLLKVCGKDYDKNTIINHLLNESSQARNPLPVISIVGMIGIEKTALAELVFKDDKVNTHFGEKIWVDVYETFDEIMIAKAILKSLKKDETPNLEKIETLFEKIRQCLEGKKFLLVLDDVWTEFPKFWKNFKFSSECYCPGSKILVTTSTVKTAKMMGTTNMILLGNEWQSSLLLSRQIEPFRKNTVEDKMLDVERWSLFNTLAFSTLTYDELGSLGHIYGKIIDTCTSFPFVIMMLGSLLGLKTEPEQWKSIYNEILKIEEMGTGFPAPLLLCYYDLPSNLRKCFSYCAIFPKDHVIDKDKLIKLWMAQGYLEGEKRKDMELVGEEYFTILTMRHFFQDFERSVYDGSIIRCKMHNIVHDFAQFLIGKEILTIPDTPQSQLELPDVGARHLVIMRGESIPIPVICIKKKLRTLVVTKKQLKGDLSELFELTYLRTLSLSECSIEKISGKIRNLIHLRYLNLFSNIYIEELPEELCELYNLQILDVSNCYRLHKLPHSIGKLINLRHLINHRTCLSYMPRGVGMLSCLQTLKKFVVSNDKRNKKVGSFECLKSLQHLEGFLSISGLGNVSDEKEINEGNLEDKEKLYCLSLRFDGWACDDDKTIFQVLKPPPNLEELVIQCYTSKTMPLDNIMSLTKLRMLKLSSCPEFERLPSLGKLSSLESLIICNMRNVGTVGNEFLGIDDSSSVVFPKLRYLKFWDMEKWEELMWSPSSESVKVLPFLRYLVLDSCPKLKSLSLFGELPSLESLAIKRMKNVKSIGNEFLGTTSSSSSTRYSFPQLISLEFEEMGEWEEWKVKWDQRVMPNLHSLKFHSCSKLEALPHDLLRRPALRVLIIKGCSILGEHYQKKTGKDWYKISHIRNIQIDSEYMRGCGFEL